MPLPMSKSALDRLGDKLASDDALPDEDLDQLAKVVRAYQGVLDGVKTQLTALGFQPTTRAHDRDPGHHKAGGRGHDPEPLREHQLG